jgi:hypothetical protein
MTKGIKHPSPLRIDMGFDEALARFAKTKPSEVEASIKRAKQKKPPGGKKRKRKPSGGNVKAQNVVQLRDRRKPHTVRSAAAR